MRILFVASGSGGHIYPAYSLLKEAKKKHQVGYVFVSNSLEEKIITDNDIERVIISLPNQAKTYLKKPYLIWNLKKKIDSLALKMQGYDVVIAFGGFITFIASLAASKARVKFYIHEQNAILGDANAFSLARCHKLFTAFKDIEVPTKYQKKTIYAGNPRADFAFKLRKVNYLTNPFKVLFLAGSLGSTTLLDIIREVTLNKQLKDIEFIVITGHKYYDLAIKEKWGDNVCLLAYSTDVLSLMRSSSLVIMRAGATSIMEIKALGIPSLLIPSPYVKHDHQSKNAMALANNNEAFMMKEKEITATKMGNFIFKQIQNPLPLIRMHQKLIKEDYFSSCEKILDVIENEGC